MKRRGILCAVLAGALVGAQARALELPDLVATARPGVVGIGNYEPLRAPKAQLTGSGFVVGDGRTIITNHHVVAAADITAKPSALVVFVGRGKSPDVRPARIVADDQFHDLAVLRIEGEPVHSLPLASGEPVREGESIAIIGFPIGAVLGLYPATNAGIVSAISPIAIPQATARTLSAEQIRRLRDPFEVYQLDLIAYPGNSGSPVFDVRSGRVIGVVNAVLARRSKEAVLKDPSAITYAIPIRHVHTLLDGL
ncbi:MAG: serine protease [Gammaproteobacteria bacterium]